MGLGWLRDRLGDVAEATWEAASEVADAAVDAVGAVAENAGDVIGTVGEVADTATLGLGSAVLNVVDNTVLDGVDEITGGVINVDYDDGDISASVGVDGVLHVGAAVGDDGISHSASVIDQSFDISATDDGFNASGQAGIDWGPLPYAAGDLIIEADGDIAFEGEAQGTLPTPYGIFSGEAEAEFMRNGEDWGGRFNTDGTWTLPNGNIVGGGLDAAYMQTGGDSVLSLGVEGSYTVPGFGTVGGSAGYDRVEAGDMVAERYTADGYAAGYGGRIEAGVTHTSATTPDGSTSEWDTRGGVSLPLLGDVLGDTDGTQMLASVVAAPMPVPAEPAAAPTASGGRPAGVPDVAAPMESAPTQLELPPEPVPNPAPEPALAAPPTDEFETALAAADDVEASVDDMFSDLG